MSVFEPLVLSGDSYKSMTDFPGGVFLQVDMSDLSPEEQWR